MQELRAALARARKAHADLLAMYEALLRSGALPREQLGFGAMRFGSTHAPAGLVLGLA